MYLVAKTVSSTSEEEFIIVSKSWIFNINKNTKIDTTRSYVSFYSSKITKTRPRKMDSALLEEKFQSNLHDMCNIRIMIISEFGMYFS
jgi:hypothetical protein